MLPFQFHYSDNAFAFQENFIDRNAGESILFSIQLDYAPVPDSIYLLSLISLGILGFTSLNCCVQ